MTTESHSSVGSRAHSVRTRAKSANLSTQSPAKRPRSPSEEELLLLTQENKRLRRSANVSAVASNECALKDKSDDRCRTPEPAEGAGCDKEELLKSPLFGSYSVLKQSLPSILAIPNNKKARIPSPELQLGDDGEDQDDNCNYAEVNSESQASIACQVEEMQLFDRGSRQSDLNLYKGSANSTNTVNSPDDYPNLSFGVESDWSALKKWEAPNDCGGGGGGGIFQYKGDLECNKENLPTPSNSSASSLVLQGSASAIAANLTSAMKAEALRCNETLNSPLVRPDLDRASPPVSLWGPVGRLQSDNHEVPTPVARKPFNQEPLDFENSLECNERLVLAPREVEALDCYYDDEDECDADLSQYFLVRQVADLDECEEPSSTARPGCSTNSSPVPATSYLVLNIPRKHRSRQFDSRDMQTPPLDMKFPAENSLDGSYVQLTTTKNLQHPDIGISSTMFRHWTNLEQSCQPSGKDYLASPVRRILVAWLMETACDLGLHRKTCQLAINYFDRFYDCVDVVPNDLHQPICAAALYIAAKKEEVDQPPVCRFIELASNATLTTPIFLAIERCILEYLDWLISPPTYHDWLTLFLRRAAVSNSLHHIFGFPEHDQPKDGQVITKPCYVDGKLHCPYMNPGYKDLAFRVDIFSNMSRILDIWMHDTLSINYSASCAVAAVFKVICQEQKVSERDIEEIVGFLSESNDDISFIVEIVWKIHASALYPLAVEPSGIDFQNGRHVYQPYYPGLEDHVRFAMDHLTFGEEMDATSMQQCMERQDDVLITSTFGAVV